MRLSPQHQLSVPSYSASSSHGVGVMEGLGMNGVVLAGLARQYQMLGARLEDARLASSALLERQHMLDRVLKALRVMGLQADDRFPKGFAGTGQILQRVCTWRADSVQVHVAILAKLIV